MIAARNPTREPESVDGVNTVHLSDGSRIHLDDIATADEGQRCLDDLDAAIDRIEGQIAAAADAPDRHDPDWRRRAGVALKRKRRMRPRLQQRIGELRRAERQAAAPARAATATPHKDARRAAFIDAAEELLEAEVFTEIWARAAEIEPAAFANRQGAAS